MFKDVTREHFRLLVKSLKDYAIIVLDQQGHVVSWNKGARDLLGYSKNEVLGQPFHIFFTPEDRELQKPDLELRQVLNKGYAQDCNWLVRKDGSKFWADDITQAIPDKSEQKLHLTKVIHDLSEYKELQRRKDEFISIASHELKTPLSIIKGYLQILDHSLSTDKQNPQNLLSYVRKSDDQISRLTDLINDLLEVSRIQSGKLSLRKERFLIDELVNDVVKDIQNITSKKIITKGSSTKPVLADKFRIRQVLVNLLTNAIKYSPKGTKVIVKISCRQGTCVSIQDFGIGISKRDQAKLFDRFFQAGNTIRQSYFGLGLGLYISSEIMKQHGGEITVKSQKKKGSTFTIKL